MVVESVNDIIKLSGDLTTNQWEAIRTAAGLVLKRHPRGVVVDCGGLSSVTQRGAETFFDMMVHIESKRARIIVANVPAHVREVLAEVPDVRSGLAIADTVDDARHSLDLLDEIAPSKRSERHSTGWLLLVMNGAGSDPHAVSLATAIAERRQLSVRALFPIVVPRSLPTSSPLPEDEQQASEALQSARSVIAGKGIPVEPIVGRCRSLSGAIQSACENVLVCVVSVPPGDPGKGEPEKTLSTLLDEIRCELVLVREPKEEK